MFGVKVSELTKVQFQTIIQLFIGTLSLDMPVNQDDCDSSDSDRDIYDEDDSRIKQAPIYTIFGLRKVVCVERSFMPITVSILGTSSEILGISVVIYDPN